MSLHSITGKLEKDESSPPLYSQLKSILLQNINEGRFESGDQLPTEHQLCDTFAISRTPVRQALKELVNEGVLSRRQGKGTFVNKMNLPETELDVLVTEKTWASPLKRAVDRFNTRKESRTVKLNLETLGRPNFYDRIVSSIGRGEAPDIALMDSVWVTEFAAFHFIESLDRLDEQWTEELKTQLFETFVEKNCHQGHLYALQPEANVSLLWYRKDEFEKLGLSPPKTWSQLIYVGKKLKKAGWERPLAFAGGTAAGESTTYQLLPFIWSAGGRIFRDDKVLLDEGDASVRAVKFLTNLIHRYKIASPDVYNFSWNKPLELFAKGEVSMAFGGSYEKKSLLRYERWEDEDLRERVGWVPLPGPKPTNRSATAGGMVYVILRQADHPSVAAEILKEVMEPESIQRFCSENDRLPTTTSITLKALDPNMAKSSHDIGSLLKLAKAPPGHVQYASVSEQLQIMLERSILKQMKPRDSVRKAAEVIRALS